LHQGINFFGSVPDLEIIPDANRKHRRVDWEVNGLLSDFSVIGEIEGPHFGTVLTIEDEGIVGLPQQELLWEMDLN
jgi:hypothetical protein